MPELLDGLILYIVFLLSTTLHEAAHAWAALKGGDPTAYEGGQVTLDPLPHIQREPLGMVVLPLISVVVMGWPLGFAHAPYDPVWAERYPIRSAWMAIAGPAANLLLVFLCGGAILLGLQAGVFQAPESVRFAAITEAAEGMSGAWNHVARFLGTFFSMNILLAAFNMIPVPPLDGSEAIVLGLPRGLAARYKEFLRSLGSMQWIGLIIAWQVFGGIFGPLHLSCINLLYFFQGASYGG